MILTGIDEAGYGPTLGPLTMVAVRVEAADNTCLERAFAHQRYGVRDSKQVHISGDLSPLERVALPALTWLTGRQPRTAADCFAALGENSEQRASWSQAHGAGWLDGAEDLMVPVAATHLPNWTMDGIEPIGIDGHLVHPTAYNHALASGLNKADFACRLVAGLLAKTPDAPHSRTVVDRLGGRWYYQELLEGAWPGCAVQIEQETSHASTYLVSHGGRSHHISFLVDGDSASPLTSLGSCLAKYARELHMLLFNRWFCARHAALRPTAGYPKDAKRWLTNIGEDRKRFDHVLIRRGRPLIEKHSTSSEG